MTSSSTPHTNYQPSTLSCRTWYMRVVTWFINSLTFFASVVLERVHHRLRRKGPYDFYDYDQQNSVGERNRMNSMGRNYC